MRRTTAGVLGLHELSDSALDALLRREPETLIRILEPLVSEARRARLRDVFSQRLQSVALVFDRPYDPHNGAAVLRSCEAFGVQALHIVEREGTPFTMARSVARSAEKWVETVSHPSAAACVAWAREARMRLVGTHPEGELAPHDLSRIPRVALVLGNEREGIRDELARECAHRVRVPMRGFVESLNVSVTAAILLHAATEGRPGDLDAEKQHALYARGLCLSVPRAAAIVEGSTDPSP